MTSGEYVATHKTLPPPSSYDDEVLEQAEKLDGYADRIKARAQELRESVERRRSER